MNLSTKSSFVDVAFAVCTAIHRAGTEAVLVGGGAATFYAPRAYRTDDMDFVVPFSLSPASAQPILALGFEQDPPGSGIYRRPDLRWSLEFPQGPLAIGSEVITDWDTHERQGEILHVIRIEDCVRDRLSAGIYWRDPNATRQAALVATGHKIDLEEIEKWCILEGGQSTFNLFKAFLANETPKPEAGS